MLCDHCLTDSPAFHVDGKTGSSFFRHPGLTRNLGLFIPVIPDLTMDLGLFIPIIPDSTMDLGLFIPVIPDSIRNLGLRRTDPESSSG